MRRSGWHGAIALVLVAVLRPTGAPGEGTPATGAAEVRVTDHRAGIHDFAALEVALTEVALHRRGEPRSQGWAPLLGRAPAVDLVPLKEGRSATVGTAPVPAARYDAVRVRFGEPRGRLKAGGKALVTPISSVVAVDLTVATDHVSWILIDLYVEDVSDHRPGHYLLKIKGVAVGSSAESKPRPNQLFAG